MIENALANYLRYELEIEPIFTKNKYKIKFSIVDEEKKKADICVRILKISNEKVCVEFKKISGD
jgi:hypothetical protein